MVTKATKSVMGLRDAADAMGVHYMTAYRYVRTGRLPAERVDGLWQVRVADVAALSRAPAVRGQGQSRTRAAGLLEQRLICGDEMGAFALVQDAMASWANPTDAHLELLAPALRSIGERWAAGELTIGDEHRATVVATRLLGRLSPLFAQRGRQRGTVVVGAPSGDFHSLPLAMASDLLRHAGFGVFDLGANTPAESFAQAAATADRLVAVSIGATLSGNEDAVAEAVAAVRQARPDATVLLGGSGLEAATASALGADRSPGDDGRLLVAAVVELSQPAGRSRRPT